MDRVNVEYHLFTDKGSRDVNEDSIRTSQSGGAFCFVLCDGLGGHGGGEIASSIVADRMTELFKEKGSDKAFFEEAFDEAQKKLLAEQKRLHAVNEMKTTAALLVISGEKYRIAHIGDSRVYVFRKNKMFSRTLDHSVPQMLVLAGDIKEKKMRHHPDRNRLLRVMGVEWDSPRYEVAQECTLKKGDAFLLCSDGFWEPITEKEMCRVLRACKTPAEWVTQMTEMIRKNADPASMDNFSAIAVFCS